MNNSISDNMYNVLLKNNRTSVWYGDLELIEECAKLSKLKKDHPKKIIKCVLNALDQSNKFEKKYIYSDFSGIRKKYRCFILKDDLVKQDKFAAQLLANEIEQFMFERGEYDFHLEDRIRWLISDSRKGNAGFIRDEILKDNIGFLTEYLTSEISSMCEDDELIPKAEKLIEELKGVIL